MNEKLKAMREARGWSIVQTAQYLQLLNDTTYRYWEQGKYVPNEKNIKRLCALFRKTREELGF